MANGAKPNYLSYDEALDWPPFCDCCGERLEPGDIFYSVNVRGEDRKICDLCFGEMEEAMVEVDPFDPC